MAAKKKHVEYIGKAHSRSITAAQWAKAGVKDQPSKSWTPKNGHKVDVEEFNDGALEVLKRDGGFRVP